MQIVSERIWIFFSDCISFADNFSWDLKKKKKKKKKIFLKLSL